jgi:hypothetical protein
MCQMLAFTRFLLYTKLYLHRPICSFQNPVVWAYLLTDGKPEAQRIRHFSQGLNLNVTSLETDGISNYCLPLYIHLEIISSYCSLLFGTPLYFYL